MDPLISNTISKPVKLIVACFVASRALEKMEEPDNLKVRQIVQENAQPIQTPPLSSRFPPQSRASEAECDDDAWQPQAALGRTSSVAVVPVGTRAGMNHGGGALQPLPGSFTAAASGTPGPFPLSALESGPTILIGGQRSQKRQP